MVAANRSRVKRAAPRVSSARARAQTTAPDGDSDGQAGASSRPVDWATAAKISGRITAPPSWLASWVVRARADTRTMTASPECGHRRR